MRKAKQYVAIALLSCMVIAGQSNAGCVYAKEKTLAAETVTGGKILEEKYNQKKLTKEKLERQFRSDAITAETEDAILSLNEEYGELSTDSENPENYAGLYLNENKEIVVNVTSQKERMTSQIEKVADGEEVKVKKVKYSLDELKQKMKQIDEYLESSQPGATEEEKAIVNDIKAFYISVEQNAVVIRVKNTNTQKEAYIRNHIVDGDNILFENTNADYVEATNLSAGQGICVDRKDGTCGIYSIGYRVWWPNSDGSLIYGFITAGHNTEIGQAVYLTNYLSRENYIGYICNKKYADNVDASVVLIENGSYSVTNNLYGSSLSLTDRYVYYSIYQGMQVGKIGQTTGYTVGTVVNPSVSIRTVDGVTLDDCFETTNHTDNGDSGGIAFTYDSSSNVMAIDGITRASNGTYSCYVKYMNIYNAFGTNAY